MSKELEALNGLAQFIIMNDNGTDESASAIEWHGVLKQALTPPTADKVCEALLKHSNFNEANYNASTRGFYSNDTTICYLGIVDEETPIIIFEYDLPPHLVTLIGRFYEGALR